MATIQVNVNEKSIFGCVSSAEVHVIDSEIRAALGSDSAWGYTGQNLNVAMEKLRAALDANGISGEVEIIGHGKQEGSAQAQYYASYKANGGDLPLSIWVGN